MEEVADDTALAERLAGSVVAYATAALAARPTFTLALAGGTTPKAAYALLAKPPYAEALDWSRVRFYFGDERCVPPDDAQSNYRMAKEAMFETLRIAPEAVARMHGEDDPAQAARAYAQRLRADLPSDRTGVPVLDLVLLGMGPDGHTASLFPGSDPFEDDDLLVRAPYVNKVAAYRLTLTPRVLNAARAIVVATAGPSKAAALAAVLRGPRAPAVYPIQILAPADGELRWLVDRAAAADLS